ncbi:MAG TPA: hypothetical protein VM409_04290, partial [Chloroflexia bacterium]|nr:hypothetical protein [Chloroflexia bacterium]
MMSPTQAQDMRALLGRYASRIRLARRRRYLTASFLALGATWLVCSLLFYSDLLPSWALAYALILPLVLPLGALALERFRRPSTIETASTLDRRLDNQQRMLTAVELLDAGEPGPIQVEQLSSTTDLLSPLDERIVYPLRSPLPAYLVTVGLLLLAVGIVLLKGAPGGFLPIQPLGLPGDQQPLSALASPTALSGLPDAADKSPEAGLTPEAGATETAGASSQGQQGVDP